MSTIILTGGGTAGHIIPNIALIPHLKNEFNKIVYIGSGTESEKNLLKKFDYVEYHSVTTAKFKRSFSFENLKIPFKLFKGISEAKKLIKKFNPEVIFSKGGYVALPVVLAGKKLGVPMIAHESDLSLGLVNKLLKNKYDTICTTFEETARKLKNGAFVGSPLRSEITKGKAGNFKAKYNINTDKAILLILGGSQGASEINQLVENNLKTLCKDFFVVHLRGKGKLNKFVKNQNYLQLEFCDNMQDLYACATLCITRGGSNTLFELLANNIPMLIIPLKKGSRGDQIENAKYFEDKNWGVALLKKDISNEDFLNAVKKLKENEKILKASIKNSPKNAVENIIKILKINKKHPKF